MYNRGCDTTNNPCRLLECALRKLESSVWLAGATTSLHKVKICCKAKRSEQNRLESLAKDGDSPVCQVFANLVFVGVC